jgi:O-antigen ligase
MMFLDMILSWATFTLVASAVLVSPWLFGAWEVWWFWPFVVCIFMAIALFSLRLLIRGFAGVSLAVKKGELASQAYLDAMTEQDATNGRLKVLCVTSFLIFLAYVVARFLHAEVVMDAQRSLLLFLSTFLLGVTIVFGFDNDKNRLFHRLILIDLLLIGLYGVINHIGWHNKLVMWADGYPQYFLDNRATGPYFCPDHFSGLMEIALSLALGFLLAREVRWQWRMFASVVALVAFTGIVLSKSRGGGLTVIVMAFAVLACGFSQWPRVIRWYLRGAGVALLILVLGIVCCIATAYIERFASAREMQMAKARSFAENRALLIEVIRESSRGRMIAGALRAWDSSRLLGIGPGMHQNLWPHFAASPDGNRELGKWPSLLNNEFHSYEVHCDWVQLLEEYGIVGLVLFLVMASVIFAILMLGLRRERLERLHHNWQSIGMGYHPLLLGGIFASVALFVHSFGDFNLQIPATVWLLTAVVAIPVACVVRDDRL